jgi:hypothetical protein
MIESKILSQCTITWLENGIIHMVYLPGVRIDLKCIKQAVADRTSISDNKPQLIFIDASNVLYWTLEAKKYGFSTDAISLIKAAAVVVNSPTMAWSWNWATTFLKLSTKTKLFTDREQALTWLEKFKS